MKVRLGVDVACRAAHQATCADERGDTLWVGHRFHTDPDQLEALWARLPADADEVTVIMEPTRNAWVALASWFRRHGATVVLVPTEQSSDLRKYYSKHAKDRPARLADPGQAAAAAPRGPATRGRAGPR